MAARVNQQVQIADSSAICQQKPASSAPVLEFMCLFTHDLRRKQKRWQDGRLKFHTFNRRIMVYDERGNFVGDTHWSEDHDFADGEEVQLERGGIIVQAAECLGSHDQDLSELINKRAQEKAQRQSAAAARYPGSVSAGRPTPIPSQLAITPHFSSRHTHLHNVIGAPTGHHGRALIPAESPYEERQRNQTRQPDLQEEDISRPLKRRRGGSPPPSKSGYAQSLFGATLTLSGRPMSSASQWQKVTKAPPPHSQPEGQKSARHGESYESQSDSDDRDPSPPPSSIACSTIDPIEGRKGAKVYNLKPSSGGKVLRPNNSIQSLLQHRVVLQKDGVGNHAATSQAYEPIIHETLEEHGSSTRHKKIEPWKEQSKANTTDSSVNVSRRLEKQLFLTEEKEHNTDDFGKPVKKNASTTTGRVSQQEGRSPKNMHTGISEEHEPISQVTDNDHRPRIELRVKPRKKRGLLMVSEREHAKKMQTIPAFTVGGSIVNSETISRHDLIEMENTAQNRRQHAQAHMDVIDDKNAICGEQDTANIQHRKERLGRERKRVSNAASPSPRERVRLSPISSAEKLVRNGQQNPGFADHPTQEITKYSKAESPRNLAASKLRSDNPAKADPRNVVPENRVSAVIGLPMQAEAIKISVNEPQPTGLAYVASANCNEHSQGRSLEPRQPPRLANLARKGIRSKEVIGFVFDDSDDEEPLRTVKGSGKTYVPPGSVFEAAGGEGDQPCILQSGPSDLGLVAANRATVQLQKEGEISSECQQDEALPVNSSEKPTSNQLSTTTRSGGPSKGSGLGYDGTNDLTSYSGKVPNENTAQPQEEAKRVQKMAVTIQQIVPKLSNPATRGKKAAKPSDAAGQIPESILPPETIILSKQIGRPAIFPTETTRGNSLAALPGFTKANGGPWSREAYDLFEYARPV
ncbi:hypothetical protein BX600DRAFT_113665 [Xylariales sp. PMI_506]|nr:hypothetical protein BX600DRAFT_113665 [Xylariales sp. PMI_506]